MNGATLTVEKVDIDTITPDNVKEYLTDNSLENIPLKLICITNSNVYSNKIVSLIVTNDVSKNIIYIPEESIEQYFIYNNNMIQESFFTRTKKLFIQKLF